MFTFGTGMALPTCMRFQEMPPELRSNSDASGNTHSDVSDNFGRDLVETYRALAPRDYGAASVRTTCRSE